MSEDELKEKIHYSQMMYREERLDYLNELLQSPLNKRQIKMIQKEIARYNEYRLENGNE